MFDKVIETEDKKSYIVVRQDVLSTVPKEEGNRHYIQIQEWIAGGGKVYSHDEMQDLRGYREKRADEYKKLSIEQNFETTVGDVFDALIEFIKVELPNARKHSKLGPIISQIETIKSEIPKED